MRKSTIAEADGIQWEYRQEKGTGTRVEIFERT